MIAPTLQTLQTLGANSRMSVITDPPELAGRIVVAIDALPCLEPFGVNAACGLVRNHHGECWIFSRELIAEGPFAILKARPEQTTNRNEEPK